MSLYTAIKASLILNLLKWSFISLKTELNFSSEIIDGEYIVDTLLIKEGNVIAVKRSFINVSKYGLGEKIYTMATEESLIYGLLAVFFALVFGFTVNETIRRFNA